ncbi:MAG TPA: restriction endonuclease subunit S [Smithellaceae bacterium]|nr:restriction endonuclease subunit S [Smithellaceae bacterium]
MRLGDYIAINPESIRKEYPFTEINYIDISSVGTGTLHGTQNLPINDSPSRAKRIVRNGDTLLATVRPNLRSFWFAQKIDENTIASTGFAILRAGKLMDKRFLYYTVTNQTFTDYLAANAKGAAYPAVDAETIERADVFVPPILTQRKIAAILSAYDDLIENNLRRIKVLEEMAQNLYREWFVKFRFPGHEKTRFTDSLLGRIPEGWEIKTLGELCTQMQSGGTPSRKKAEFWDGGDIDWYKTMELWDRFLISSEEKITVDGLKGSSARLYEPGTILMAIYGSLTVGRLGIVTQRAACNQAAIGMLVNPILASQQFLFYALYELRGHFNSIAQGAAQQNISKAKVAEAQCVLPPINLMEYFTNHVVPIWSLLENLQKKNNCLRRTRDLLLPKLISGEVDVSELDITIPEEAV